MKVYYSIIQGSQSNNEDNIIDDYVVDYGLGAIQFDARTGDLLHSYFNLEHYLESYPKASLVEVDFVV